MTAVENAPRWNFAKRKPAVYLVSPAWAHERLAHIFRPGSRPRGAARQRGTRRPRARLPVLVVGRVRGGGGPGAARAGRLPQAQPPPALDGADRRRGDRVRAVLISVRRNEKGAPQGAPFASIA